MDESRWQTARLIPVSGLGGAEEKERRATSALLAVLRGVKEFNRAFLGALGAPASTPATFTEVPFTLQGGRKVRVDGLIRASRGKKTWTLLVEVKTGTNELGQQQVEDYLDVAKEQGFDGLLTISNQIVPAIDQHPVRVDKRRLRGLRLYHSSWMRILSLAQLVKEHRGVEDPDQAWILGELIRYLEYHGSGAVQFDDMGPHWVSIRSAVRDQTLRSVDDKVRDVVARWDQLVHFLSLRLGARLGQEVRPVASRKEANDPDQRMAGLARTLVQRGVLDAVIRIPDTIGPVRLSANLRTMRGTASTDVPAPETKRATSRVNWLLRQLRKAPPELRVDALYQRGRASSELLQTLTENPKAVLVEGDRLPGSFVVALSSPLGSKRRTGKGSFVSDVSGLLDTFYRDVVQDLRPWTRPAPQLRPDEISGDGEEVSEAQPDEDMTQVLPAS